jgi:CDP-glycerol glycerophosphotransferase
MSESLESESLYGEQKMNRKTRPTKAQLRRLIFRKIKRIISIMAKKTPRIRAYYRKKLKNSRYKKYKKLQHTTIIEDKVIMFESYMGRSYSCNPKALYQEMLRDPRYVGWTFIWVFRLRITELLRREAPQISVSGVEKLGAGIPESYQLSDFFSKQDLEELSQATVVAYTSPEYYRQRARAKYLITNSIMPTHMTPTSEQILVQTWHGTPLKRLGVDLAAGTDNGMYSSDEVVQRYRQEATRINYMLSPSNFCTEKFRSAFDLASMGKADCIIQQGYPRNDYLSRFLPDDVRTTKVRLGIPENKKVILYAPTFRDNQHRAGRGFSFELAVDFCEWQRRLGSDYIVLFRAHYLVSSRLDLEMYNEFEYDVSRIGDINDLYIVSDILVTDYSSVFFDYAILHRPILFYMYDRADYAKELRGFYLDLDELPGPIIESEIDLLNAVISIADREDQLPYPLFEKKFFPLEDGKSAYRSLNEIHRLVMQKDMRLES